MVHTKTVIKNAVYEQLKLKSSQDIVNWCLSLIQRAKFSNFEEQLISIFLVDFILFYFISHISKSLCDWKTLMAAFTYQLCSISIYTESDICPVSRLQSSLLNSRRMWEWEIPLI